MLQLAILQPEDEKTHNPATKRCCSSQPYNHQIMKLTNLLPVDTEAVKIATNFVNQFDKM